MAEKVKAWKMVEGMHGAVYVVTSKGKRIGPMPREDAEQIVTAVNYAEAMFGGNEVVFEDDKEGK